MNHDGELRVLGAALKIVLVKFETDIDNIKDWKHRIEQKQNFDKMKHWMLKMSEELDYLNKWLTEFGGDEQ